MIGFCNECGTAVGDTGVCVNGHQPILSGTTTFVAGRTQPTLMNLPKADTTRRLLGSGIEVLFVFALDLAGYVPIAGIIPGFLALVFVLTKDMGSGRFSVGKRVARMRIVDVKTGAPASKAQGL